MEIEKLIEKLIPLGVVEFIIDGDSEYPTSYRKSGSTVTIDGDRYQLEDVQIVSIDMVKVNSIMGVFNDLISQSNGNDERLDLKEFESIKILKKLDSLDNDIERLKYIQTTLSANMVDGVGESVEIKSKVEEDGETYTERGQPQELDRQLLDRIIDGGYADDNDRDRFSRFVGNYRY